jgi:hypothetical protein
MYEWKQSSSERWVVLLDRQGDRHLVPTVEVKRVYEYIIGHNLDLSPAKRGVIVELRDGTEIKSASSLGDLIETIAGKGA